MIEASPAKRMYFRKSGRMRLEADIRIEHESLESVSHETQIHFLAPCLGRGTVEFLEPPSPSLQTLPPAHPSHLPPTTNFAQRRIHDFRFEPEDARSLSDFLVPLLDVDPCARPEISEVLQHPWLKRADSRQQRGHSCDSLGKRRSRRWWRPWGNSHSSGEAEGGRPGKQEETPTPAIALDLNVFSDTLVSE